MPIFVQWKWKEETKTFLVIFHFFDDYSKPNLRIRNKSEVRYLEYIYLQKKAWTTWAPSHVELGMLSELLSYANIVNGLKESEMRKMRNELEGESWEAIDDIESEMPKGANMLKSFDRKEPYFLVELCPEYINYLKKVLKRYLNRKNIRKPMDDQKDRLE